MKNYVFTVFTPAYNRAHTLPRLYRSIRAQSFQDFEWVIVDDGSTDNTRELVMAWQKEAAFPIRYFYQANQGKHVAHNLAVREAAGELVAIIDSDDELLPESLETLHATWTDIPENARLLYAGITCPCRTAAGDYDGSQFPQELFDSNEREIRYKYKLKGERWGCLRADVLRAFPFPVLPQTKYVPEGLLWLKIAAVYQTRYINKALRIYHQEGTIPGGQLSHQPPVRTCQGMALLHGAILNNDLAWFPYAPGTFLKSAVHYVRFSLHAGHAGVSLFSALKGPVQYLLCALAVPAGVLLYLRDQQRYGTP